jgi:hypothetical protein
VICPNLEARRSSNSCLPTRRFPLGSRPGSTASAARRLGSADTALALGAAFADSGSAPLSGPGAARAFQRALFVVFIGLGAANLSRFH